MGASFAAVSPEHPLARALEGDPAVAAFLAECRAMGTSEEEIETAEKKGFDTGIRVVHPFDPDWELPVYIANFILMDYGTGAIFGCPAHDQRDLDFARKYGLPVIDVYAAPGSDARVGSEAYVPPKSEPVAYLRPVAGGGVMTGDDAVAAAIARCEAEGFGAGRDQVPAARLGPEPPALLGLPDPGGPLRRLRHRAREAREPAGAAARTTPPSTGPATRWSGIRPGRRPPARPAAARRGARPTPWTPSSIRPGTSRASPRRTRPSRPACPRPTTG